MHVGVRLQIPLRYGNDDGRHALAYIETPEEVLDVVDAILNVGGPWPQGPAYDSTGELYRREVASTIQALRLILDHGMSAYRVSDDLSGLERRVDAIATAAAEAAMASAGVGSAGSAAGQLRTAWAETYGLHPDPPAAYRAAIQAVESAVHAVIEPNNAKATLGTMLRILQATPGKFRVSSAAACSVDAVTKMIEMLWTGQTSRHGGQAPTRPEKQAEAETAVHLAILLVQWFTTGAVRRV